jgi:hypothetical protein
MFWGCICHDGVGTITDIQGSVDSIKYINVLEISLWSVIAKYFASRPWMFQDDNCP